MPVVQRVTAVGAGNMLLAGSLGTQPWVREIDTAGAKVREFPIRLASSSAVAAVIEDGNAVAACEQGTFPDSEVWVGRVSPGGEVKGDVTFPGRPTDLARGADGSFAVAIEQRTPAGSDILLKGLSAGLKEQWSRVLAGKQRVAGSFRLAAVDSGGYVVAGSKDRGLLISRVKADGTALWTEQHEPQSSAELELTMRVELAHAGDTYVAAYTAFISVGREQRQVVRVIRFEA